MSASAIGTITPAELGRITGRGLYRRNRMVNYLNRQLMGLFGGEFDNLGVSGPPRHGKTKLLNELAAAHFLGTNPTKQVIAASHSATLASRFGKNVRDLLKEFGPDVFGVRVDPNWQAVDNWGLTEGGGMLSIGVGGSLVGHGADLFIFDDIIADAASALSETVRNNTMDWYESTAETRINSGGKQIFTMQRWHDDDPYRRVVKDNPRKWRDVEIRAIAEEDDVLGRPAGEALWPEKYPIEVLREMEARKAFWFAAQYQQRPVPRGGGMFQLDWIEDNAVWYRPTTDTPRIRWWDLAATEGDGDYTVGALLSRKGDSVYVEDIVRGQWGPGNRDRVIRQTCEDDNRRYPNGVVTWFEQEPGSAGKVVGELSTKKLAPFAAHAETSSGQKVVRADGLASAFSRGEVHACKGLEDNRSSGRAHSWYGSLVVEFTTFPSGKHDDIVDACFPAGTLVRTACGQRPIEAVKIGDLVATRFGFRRVLASGLTNINARVISVDTSSGAIIRLTPNHPVYVRGRGFIPAGSIAAGDELVSWEESRLSCIAGSFSGAIRTLRTYLTGDISRPAPQTPSEAWNLSTEKSGRTTTGRYRPVMRSTTTTRTRSTTTPGTSSASARKSTASDTGTLTGPPSNWSTSAAFDPSRSIGIGATRAGVGTAITPSRPWPLSSGSSGLANSAASGSSPNADRLGSARRSATPDSGRPAARSWWTRFAFSAARIFAGLAGSRPVRVSAVRGCDGDTRLPVYNLSVEGHPEYFANGILVHNCSGAYNKLVVGEEPCGYASVTDQQYAEIVAQGGWH